MKYKGYEGIVEVDEDGETLYGHVIGLRDVITFQGETVIEARKAFQESVDDYLAFCEELGEAPEKPYSGRFMLRVPPQTHRQLAQLAEAHHTSLNTFVANTLQERVAALESKRTALKSKARNTRKARKQNAALAKKQAQKRALRKDAR